MAEYFSRLYQIMCLFGVHLSHLRLERLDLLRELRDSGRRFLDAHGVLVGLRLAMARMLHR